MRVARNVRVEECVVRSNAGKQNVTISISRETGAQGQAGREELHER
jgi:hypothetical protein